MDQSCPSTEPLLPACQTLATRAVLMVLSLFSGSGCDWLSPHPPPHVILITVDTLRADHVGAYGQSPLPTPAFDSIGTAGAVVAQAFAPFGRTTQSLGSILTGLHPLKHGADGLGMTLADENHTLSEILGEHGYRRGAFVSNLWIQKGHGFEQGFDVFTNPPERWEKDSAPQITGEALAWTRDSLQHKQPVFLWAHYLDPHWPYEPPARFAQLADPSWDGSFDLFAKVSDARGNDAAPDGFTKGRVIFDADKILTPRELDHVRKLYAAEVAATDAAVGDLLAGLQQLGVLDNAIVVFTADHGESLGEHRYWFAHGEYLYDETLQVPMMIRAPGIPKATRVEGNVLLMDILPTILGLAGFEVPNALDGANLSDRLRGGGTVTVEPRLSIHLADHVLVRAENPRRQVAGRAGRWCAAREATEKLITIPLRSAPPQRELYDLGSDPLELHDLATMKPAPPRFVDACAAVPVTGPETVIDPENRERARSIGYVGDQPEPQSATPQR